MALADALVYELYGLSEDEIRIIEDADSRRLTADSSRLTACGLRLLDIRRGRDIDFGVGLGYNHS